FGSDQIFCFTATPAPLAAAVQQSVPGVESIVRTSDASGELLTYKNNSFTDHNGLFADSSFFDVFSYPFLEGQSNKALNQPNSIVLTKKMADILFGREDPIGKSIRWNSNEDLTVTGVINNPPANSWMADCDYIVTWHLLEKEYGWARN